MVFRGVNSPVPELLPEEKSAIYAAFEAQGLTKGTVYNRVFRSGEGSGFDEWELRGILNVVRDFEVANGLPVTGEADLPGFYDRLQDKSKTFWPYMQALGLGTNSIIYRFKNWNFKPWELKGIRAIIDDMELDAAG